MNIFKNLREVIKGLKHKKLSETAPKFCPKCGSQEIRLSSSFNAYPKMYGITPGQYICESCDYKGPAAIELEEENS